MVIQQPFSLLPVKFFISKLYNVKDFILYNFDFNTVADMIIWGESFNQQQNWDKNYILSDTFVTLTYDQ